MPTLENGAVLTLDRFDSWSDGDPAAGPSAICFCAAYMSVCATDAEDAPEAPLPDEADV
jgi:hypothetical protein